MKAIFSVLVSLGFLAACSGGSAVSGPGGASGTTVDCGKTGDKDCPNDAAYTQADVDACNRCKSQLQALADCLKQYKSICGADGTSEPLDVSTCPMQATAFTQCTNMGGTAGH